MVSPAYRPSHAGEAGTLAACGNQCINYTSDHGCRGHRWATIRPILLGIAATAVGTNR
jgi:hypothetical protein